MAWSGYMPVRGGFHSHAPLHNSRGRSRRKKWAEARRWAGSRALAKNTQCRVSSGRTRQRLGDPRGYVAPGSAQMKTVHCLTGISLVSSAGDVHAGRRRGSTLSRTAPTAQQKALWAGVRKETEGGRTGSRSGTSLLVQGAASWLWTSSPRGCGEAGPCRG